MVWIQGIAVEVGWELVNYWTFLESRNNRICWWTGLSVRNRKKSRRPVRFSVWATGRIVLPFSKIVKAGRGTRFGMGGANGEFSDNNTCPASLTELNVMIYVQFTLQICLLLLVLKNSFSSYSEVVFSMDSPHSFMCWWFQLVMGEGFLAHGLLDLTGIIGAMFRWIF